MKAWIAHIGRYECESTEGVFLDKAKADFWKKANSTSNRSSDAAWLEEVDIIDDSVENTQLYVIYKIVYNGKKLIVSRWEFSTKEEENKCDIVGEDGYTYYEAGYLYSAGKGDFICDVCLKEEEASKALAQKTAAEVIAKYKIEHPDTGISLVDEYLIKNKKEI